MRKHLNGRIVALGLSALRIWLGVQWLQAGYSKLGSEFDASGFLHGAIASASGENPRVQGWYASFLEGVALPNIELFNILVPWGELLVGLGLISGLATVPALIAGAFMNANFIMAGVGFSSLDGQLFVIAMILLLIGKSRYYYGLDRFVIPYFKKHFLSKRGMLEIKGKDTGTGSLS
ncbi:thiosulfate dehydrogenase [quinone] large subunit [Mesobacillus persicus]|uniref:Thiosulfate dehydrogenase [quinone] large subunit n=1 Tax=Mesobacillus persicus TaxID=930146 RepID=A0A1H8AZZ2_9BACI|nr:DoxX family protein [Mesobacillus persicus]SEM76300.1 thiosulfate dehydrogenase [quinone] large subunit [Mesobacillus persicus]